MDVNETLRLLRRALLIHNPEGAWEHFRALDEWLSKGGSLPRDWQAHRVIEDHFAPRED